MSDGCRKRDVGIYSSPLRVSELGDPGLTHLILEHPALQVLGIERCWDAGGCAGQWLVPGLILQPESMCLCAFPAAWDLRKCKEE